MRRRGSAPRLSSLSFRSSSKVRKPAYTYQANLQGGKKYIGMATSKPALVKRIQTQLSGGKGASSVCKQNKPSSISKVFKHPSVAAAKKAEAARYYSTKAILGSQNVRGAGHTKPFASKYRR